MLQKGLVEQCLYTQTEGDDAEPSDGRLGPDITGMRSASSGISSMLQREAAYVFAMSGIPPAGERQHMPKHGDHPPRRGVMNPPPNTRRTAYAHAERIQIPE